MNQYRVTEPADSDLLDIWLSIAPDDLAAAEHVLGGFFDTFVLLGQNPKMGRARPELSRKLRSFPKGKYIIFYHLVTDGIEIVRVLHGSRDLESIFGEP